MGVAVNSMGQIYVLASYTGPSNMQVRRYDANGGYQMYWGSLGSQDGQFSYARGIAVDGNDFIYLCDTGNNRVQKFDKDGNFIMKFGAQGTGNGEFDQPRA